MKEKDCKGGPRRIGPESGKTDESEALEDIALFLLYASSWKEKVTPGFSVLRSWKGYGFRVLDALEKKGYVSGSHRAKSVILTDDGMERANKLKERILRALAASSSR